MVDGASALSLPRAVSRSPAPLNNHSLLTHTHTHPMASASASSSSAIAQIGALLPPLPLSPRRLPPPCWSHDETLALIASYGEKWHSLGRGSLRAPHWDDVSAAVSRNSPSPKTPLQCRHKIEKLRKRYRSENRHSLSSWLYFPKMDAMERGAAAAEGVAGLRFAIPKAVRSKIAVKPALEEMRRRVEGRRMREDEGGIGDLASALGVFGQGFLRMERMKMDASREVEKMRMDMELKRTEMILDCQRQIVQTMLQRFM